VVSRRSGAHALATSDEVQHERLWNLWRAIKIHFRPNDKLAVGEMDLREFLFDRLAGSLRDQGYSAQEVDAVVSQKPQRLGDIPKRLAAVRAFASLPEAAALAAANKRISNILKKADTAVDAHVSTVLLTEPAEIALNKAYGRHQPRSAGAVCSR